MDLPIDLTFITNEGESNLLDRFTTLIKDTRYFDMLVGYFYITGFYSLYKTLEKTEKIRILVGMDTDIKTKRLMDGVGVLLNGKIEFSHSEVKEIFDRTIVLEMEESEDSSSVEEGIIKFLEWIKSGKLEIRGYPSKKLHAKLYIMTFKEGDRDVGRVITGSSNFTYSGLVDNFEFNVELKNRVDYEFALEKFNELWEEGVDLRDIYSESILVKTWINREITPYKLYLKFLYEYFKGELSLNEEILFDALPEGFKNFEYQRQAVLNAKKILEEYGGVFISDVVGLGKTYITAMLIKQLEGRTLVIAPPTLLDENNPGSWKNVFLDFDIPAKFGSIGKLDAILDEGVERFSNIVIDEAHRFRTETTSRHEILSQICRGKRVILVTATPYNNAPRDILSQIKLFQNSRKSTIPNLPDLEEFFSGLERKLKGVDKRRDYEEYIKVVKENAREIRERVLKYLMVRRTRSEIKKYFPEDTERQGLKFPEISDPVPLYYELNEREDEIFNRTIELITQKFKYSRYTPLLYLKEKIGEFEATAQKNMGGFMKVLLIKRLESSFYAFKNSIDRFINSYEMFLKEFENGNVYVSKKYIGKIFEYIENDMEDEIQRLIDEDKAKRYDSADFTDEFKKDLLGDLKLLKEIKKLWEKVDRDPKLLKLKEELSKNPILKGKKLIIFTESKETAEFLTSQLGEKTLCYHGGVGESVKRDVIENFDAKARNKRDDYMILVATETLSEGVNLHRSNVVINYDIPWNPTRIMQRVGRVNRVDTNFDKIHIFNFFPTAQAEDEIKLRKTAESKINAFLTLLGGDAAILTEGEPVSSHELFNKLLSKETASGEEDLETSELKYLNVIKEVRDKAPELFEEIKQLPKKARSAKLNVDLSGCLLTYFRFNRIQKFFITNGDSPPKELDFIEAAKTFESLPEEKREDLSEDFYKLLNMNKESFKEATTEELLTPLRRKGRSSVDSVLKILRITLKNAKGFTEDQENYLHRVIEKLEEGAISKKTVKRVSNKFKKLGVEEINNPFKLLAILEQSIPERLLMEHFTSNLDKLSGKREVILSLYLTGGGKNEGY